MINFAKQKHIPFYTETALELAETFSKALHLHLLKYVNAMLANEDFITLRGFHDATTEWAKNHESTLEKEMSQWSKENGQ